MLQEVVNILTKNNFFEGKNVYAYQKKNKNRSPSPTSTYRTNVWGNSKW